MAPITKSIALAGALFATFGATAPVNKRAVVWETVTDVVWTTVEFTTTIYPDQALATSVVAAVTTSAAPTTTTTTTPQATPVEQPQTWQQAEAKAVEPTTTTSIPVAPAFTEQPTTSAIVEPVTTSTWAPSTTTAPAVAADTADIASTASTASNSGTSSGYSGSCSESSPCTGQLTYYDTATLSTNPSSCGMTNDGETEFVLALPHGIMTDADCGKSVKITYNGVSRTGKVVDKCMGCDNTSIDLSRALFGALASMSVGRIHGAEWYIE